MQLNYKNVAVIGSNGFIGSNLVNHLRRVEGVNLFLFGKRPVSVHGDHLPYKQITLGNADQIKRDLADIDIIYYLASETIPASSWNTPVMDVENNLVPFLKFMEAVVTLNVKKIVFLSSAGTIYGPTNEKANENSFKLPFSPHGIVKLSMEYFLNYFHRKNNISFDVFRVSNVYGEGQDTQKGIGIINTFLESILKQGKINIFGDGENVRNYLYVQDLAQLLTLALYTDPASSDVFNAASNDTLSINQLVEIIKQVVSRDFEVIYTENRKSDNSTIYLDNTHMLSVFPQLQLTPLKDGIAQTYQHIMSLI